MLAGSEMTTENAGAGTRPADRDALARASRARRPADLAPLRETRAGQLPPGARPARNAIMGAAMIGYAWLLAGMAPFSTRALVTVLLPGAALGVIAFARPPERIPAPESLDVTGFSYWLIVIALLLEWEASAVRSGSTPAHPSLTELVNPLIAAHPVKSGAIVVWLLAGWALVRR